MNTSDKYLLHTIDAATLKGSRNRHSGLGGTVFVLLLTCAGGTVVMLRYLGYV